MLAWLFNRDRAKARTLVNLATRTVDMMQRMIPELDPQHPDRKIIESHLAKRRRALDKCSMLASGEMDAHTKIMERVAPTLRYFEIYKRSMEGELGDVGPHPRRLAAYIREIRR